MAQHVALYARVSSTQQVQDKTIEAQIAALEAYATEQGVPLQADLYFLDEGISGTSLARPGLDQLRDHAFHGHVDGVLVLNPDRLARKYAHQLLLIEELRRLGVEIIFANRQLSDSPEDQLLGQLQGVIAECAREKILERSRRGKLHKAKQGHLSVLSCAPYGYVYIPKGHGEDARVEMHPEEAHVVKLVFRLFLEEQMSLHGIARYLTAQGIASRHRAPVWHKSVVWGMLKNPADMGQAASLKTRSAPRQRNQKRGPHPARYTKRLHSSRAMRPESDWISIAVPAIIDPKYFEQAKITLEENKKFSPRNNTKHPYLLNGLLRCKNCGFALYGTTNSARHSSSVPLSYYCCYGASSFRRRRGEVCNARSVRRDILEALVWSKLEELLQNPRAVIEEYTRRVKSTQKQEDDLALLLKQKRTELRRATSAKDRLVDLYQSGVITKAEITDRMAACRSKLTMITSELRYLEAEQADSVQRLQVIERLGDFTAQIGANLQSLDFDRRKAIVRLLVKEIKVDTHNHQIDIDHLLPIDQKVELRSDHARPAAASASGALRGVHAGTGMRLMGCKSPGLNCPFGGLAGGRVSGAIRGLSDLEREMQSSGLQRK